MGAGVGSLDAEVDPWSMIPVRMSDAEDDVELVPSYFVMPAHDEPPELPPDNDRLRLLHRDSQEELSPASREVPAAEFQRASTRRRLEVGESPGRRPPESPSATPAMPPSPAVLALECDGYVETAPIPI